MVVGTYNASVSTAMASTDQLDSSVTGYLALQLAILGFSAIAAGAVVYDVYLRYYSRKEDEQEAEKRTSSKGKTTSSEDLSPSTNLANGQLLLIPETVDGSYQTMTQAVPRKESRKASMQSLQALQPPTSKPSEPFLDHLLDQVDLFVDTEDVTDEGSKDIEKQLGTLRQRHIALHHASDVVARSLAGFNEDQRSDVNAVAPSVQRAVRSQWAMLRRLMACADVHLKHSAENIKFHQQMLDANIQVSVTKVKATETLKAAKEENDLDKVADMLDSVCKDILETENIVQLIIARLREKQDSIVPINLRTESLKEPQVSVALCSYQDKQADVTSGETLLLLDNTDPQSWKVKNMSAEEFTVPSTIILIPGPDDGIRESVNKLNENTSKDLLDIWKTLAEQTLEKIDTYLLQKTGNGLPRMDSGEKYKLLVVIQQLIELLEQNKLEQAFPAVMDHAQKAKVKVAAIDVSENPDLKKLMSDSLGKYQSTLEESMRKVDAENLNLLNVQTLRSAEASSLPEQDLVDALEDADDETEVVDVTVSGEIQHESASAETSLYSAASQEVRHTFSISAVLDAKTGKELSMDEAIKQGLLDKNNGMYINNVTKEEIPIPEAMSKGFIKVESTQTFQSSEQVQSVGIMTITIRKETREFTVTAIRDQRTDKKHSVEDAVAMGLYNVDKKTIRNPDTDGEMSIEDAITCGAADVEYNEDVKPGQIEVLKKTLAVSHVIDKKAGKRVTFGEAVKRGLLDVETSEFINNQTGERVYAAEALKKGYIRAKVVEDPSVLDTMTDNRSRRSSLDSQESGPATKVT